MKTTLSRIVLFGLLMAFVIPATAQMRSNKFGVGPSASYYLLQVDYGSGDPSLGGGVDLSYSIIEYMSIRASMGFGYLAAKNSLGGASLNTVLVHGNLYLAADFMPHGTVNPFVFVGGTGMYIDPRTGAGDALTGSETTQLKGSVVGGVGVDFFVSEFLSFTVAGEMALPITDRLDGIATGEKDSFQRISLGIRYYFFDQDFITRMLKALEERYK
ncbi:MAG: outer membrane beta-barrel protein [Ignavibacterium sp.]|jgi:hypothetical protein